MLEINNLYFSYNSKAPLVLENVSLSIHKGSYVSILGDNGSGKSTLIKLVLKLLKPTSGKILVKTNNIGYVPQRMESFNAQFPITVSELLGCHMKILKIKDSSAIDRSLQMVNMLEYKNTLIGGLSGGQQQKIFIARALMGMPELLILDEPSTGIDIESQKEIYGIIKNLNMNQNITVVSVEHNYNAAINNSTHIFRMDKDSSKLYTIEEYNKLNN
ncbi:metal ABC transporter ATP-binding protein [Clostridium omnivorum]|uniref:Metal ABC transporter ATP-binding protein n=1 Tax=Clostridium omnivorum TaxID=1604902 RepID=A0ABQ5N1Y9_9CLOT|nr:metal ABC transporter ATP-binding protein [Clostridium sp. E14]GLC29208.1 metal ABC transporter ATP-binding protein [Clostridium sp. E14]